MLDVLQRRSYVDVENWELTGRGRVLSRVFHESDLLVTECLHGGLLDGLNAAAIGLMAAVTIQVGLKAVADPASIIIGLAALVGLVVIRVPSILLVVAGGAAGMLLSAVGFGP